MSGHTPGPWQRNIYSHGGSRIFAGDSYPTLIADTYQARDADLLFYAPDMLRVLTAAEHALRAYEFGNASPDLARQVADAVKVVLNKAEGNP